MTTKKEEWILYTDNHVSVTGLIYTEIDSFQSILFLINFFSIMSNNDYIHMSDFTLRP